MSMYLLSCVVFVMYIYSVFVLVGFFFSCEVPVRCDSNGESLFSFCILINWNQKLALVFSYFGFIQLYACTVVYV